MPHSQPDNASTEFLLVVVLSSQVHVVGARMFLKDVNICVSMSWAKSCLQRRPCPEPHVVEGITSPEISMSQSPGLVRFPLYGRRDFVERETLSFLVWGWSWAHCHPGEVGGSKSVRLWDRGMCPDHASRDGATPEAAKERRPILACIFQKEPADTVSSVRGHRRCENGKVVRVC